MEENRITAQMLKELVRYERSLESILPPGWDLKETRIDRYFIQWDDLEALIRNLREKDPAAGELAEKWVAGLWLFDEIREHLLYLDPESYAVFRAESESEDGVSSPRARQVNAMAVFIASIVECGMTVERDRHDFIDFDMMQQDLALLMEENYSEVCMERWNDMTKLALLDSLDDPQFRAQGKSRDRGIWRGIVEEMCAKDYWQALARKGYSCYGGDELYSCDWETSRDCMLRLMTHPDVEDEDRGRYATTLGYIAYYGRCNGGEPRYEEAARYFTVGMGCGYFESYYKMADLFVKGEGVIRNEHAAMNLVSYVYSKTREFFLQGDYGCSFADAALRLGNYYRDGIGTEPDLWDAYGYFCIAQEAIMRRREEDPERFGDGTVMKRIEEALEKSLEDLPQVRYKHSLRMSYPALLYAAVSEDHTALFKVKKLKSGVSVTAQRVPRGDDEPAQIMIVFPEEGQCMIRDRVTQRVRDVRGIRIIGGGDSFRANRIKRREMEWGDLYFFFRDDELTAVIDAGRFECTLENRQPAGRPYKVASVAFYDGGKLYDFLCGNLDVQVGDRVIVDGKTEDKEVRVMRVEDVPLSALEDRPEHYLKIKRIVSK